MTRLQADRDLESGFLNYLSMVHLQGSHLDKAIDYAEISLTLRIELGLHLKTVDNLATLAGIYLMSGNLDQALQYTQQALITLEECAGQGPEFSQRDYFICYRVLTAANQPEQAQLALKSAYSLVMARSEKIIDSSLRQSFLENVPINREIVASYHAQANPS